MAVSVSIPIPPQLLALVNADPNGPTDAVLQSWRDNADTLLEIEKFNVQQRTLERAFDTGALASSVTGNTGGGGKNLISVWFNNAQQYAQWHRYYAPYQEGPPIGLSTYTNGPRHMLFDSQTDDASAIQQWGVEYGGEGADAWASMIGGA